MKFKVILSPLRIDSTGLTDNLRNYQFELSVKSTNPENETTMYDNSLNLVLPVYVETSLSANG